MLDKVSDDGAEDASGADAGKRSESHTAVAKTASSEVVQKPSTEVSGESEKKPLTLSVAPERSGFVRFVSRFFMILLQAGLMIAVLAASYFIAQRMIASKPEPRSRPPFKTVYTVETATAVAADNQPVFVSYGQTVAERTVDLRALVSGEIVEVNPNLRGGARVEKGDPLLKIDRFAFEGALSEAKANLAEAQARITENEAQIELEQGRLVSAQEQLEFAQADLERAESLFRSRSTTQQQVEARKIVLSQRRQTVSVTQDTIRVQQAKLEQLRASIDRLQWRVNQAQRNLDSTVLVAPFNGIVRVSNAELGRLVTANDVVVSLYKADGLEAKFTLTDTQFGRLQSQQGGLIDRPVTVAWSIGGKEFLFDGSIARIGADITSNRGGVEVIAAIEQAENSMALRPGAFVEVRVPDVVFADSFRIPDTALYNNDTVYVAVDGKLVERKVEIAAFENENVIISSGLEPGDEVLTTRITEVSEGLSVRREGDPVPPRNTARETAGEG
ncbi:MAG: efflux RND transporter periplasmic adaptor subunit [Pseudomonadota bacterium]